MRFGRLDHLPRVRLGHTPTPLETAPRLTALNGGARLLIKRDDCTGLAFGGNKVRQLEFYLGDAQARDADVILITGAMQSNFARLAAAGARALGMDIHVQLENRVARSDPLYLHSGNVLLDRLLGATIHCYPDGEDEAGADANLERIAAQLRERGRRPYVIRLAPGHPPLGALGYVAAARELVQQMQEQGVSIDEFIVPSGSGATHAGLLFGLRRMGVTAPVTGVCVRRDAPAQSLRIAERCAEIAGLLELPPAVTPDDIRLTDDFLAPGYGEPNAPTRNAIADAARTEALMLDPVYSGKAMAAALALARRRGAERSVLFLHTGGTPAIFAYGGDLAPAPGTTDQLN